MDELPQLEKHRPAAALTVYFVFTFVYFFFIANKMVWGNGKRKRLLFQISRGGEPDGGS